MGERTLSGTSVPPPGAPDRIASPHRQNRDIPAAALLYPAALQYRHSARGERGRGFREIPHFDPFEYPPRRKARRDHDPRTGHGPGGHRGIPRDEPRYAPAERGEKRLPRRILFPRPHRNRPAS